MVGTMDTSNLNGGGTVTAGHDDVGQLVDRIDAALRRPGTPARAKQEKAYLKNELAHYGTTVAVLAARSGS